jgi:N-acetylneuraminic acid mutarotase
MKLTIKILLNCIFLLLLSCNSAEESPYPELVLQNENLSMIPARATAVSFVIGDNAYIALGRTAGHRSAGYTDIWEYNINTKTATAKADFPGTGRVGPISEVVDGKAYIGLGFNPEKGVYDATSRLDDFWMYDATNNTWTQKASFPKRTNGETSGRPRTGQQGPHRQQGGAGNDQPEHSRPLSGSAAQLHPRRRLEEGRQPGGA